MTLASGARVGPYAIVAAIGAGGMGEVYKARDTKLNRDVALKVLPKSFALDPDRLARFQREAQVLASLNHPNIAAIYGLEESDGVRALVLELVEGPTLADRVAQGPIPLDEALPIARQIADALEAAHEHGAIHRDLKPANIKVRPDGAVKVLDFGLAKAFDVAPTSDLSESPTMTSPAMTGMGVILGTAAYMSPEQAKGKPVDKRADIWAFGCVLFEMLTGKRAFEGEDVAETLGAVIHKEPVWTALPANTPPAVRTGLQRCLQKDPRQRVRDIGDVRLAIEGAFETVFPQSGEAPLVGAPQRVAWGRAITLVLAAALVAALASGVAVWSFARVGPAVPPQVTRFAVAIPQRDVIDNDSGMALSPDGSRLVYSATRDGVRQLFVRGRDQLEPVPIRGTEDAVHPFFSPDGAWVGFFTSSALKKVAITGGPAVTLCQVGRRRGATWGSDDTIVFSSVAAPGLMRVSASGGEPELLSTPKADEGRHNWPEFLPGGKAVLFTTGPEGPISGKRVALLSLETGEQRILVDGTDGHFVPSGHLVFGREASLWAAPFDVERLAVTGEAAPILEGVQVNTGGGWALYAVSNDGSLVYLPGGSGEERTLVWVDREGREEPINAPPRAYVYPRLSPDGTRVALDVRDQEQDIWVWDFARQTLTRLTFDPAPDTYPVWTPDARRLIFSSARAGPVNPFWQAANGTGSAERLAEDSNGLDTYSVSPDAKRLVLRELAQKTGYDVVMLSMDGERRVVPLLNTQFSERNAEISPDGRWLAYQSNESGVFEIYVRPFPDVNAGRWQISTGGGEKPLWARSGGELFYLTLTESLMSVPLQVGASFTFGNAGIALEEPYFAAVFADGRTYDVSPDGRRFLMIKEFGRAGETAPAQLIFVENWVEELKRLVPTR